MNEQTLAEILELWGNEYERARAEGLKHTPSKNRATTEIKRAYPFLSEYFTKAHLYRAGQQHKDDAAAWGMRLSARMARLGYKLRLERDKMDNDDSSESPIPSSPKTPPPSPNGSYQRRKPGLVLYDSGYSNVSGTVINAIKSLDLSPGDKLSFGDMKFWGEVVGCSESAIPNIIQGAGGQTQLTDMGYVFETVDKSYRDFIVRAVTVPRTAEEIRREKRMIEIEAQLAQLAAELASIKK